MLRKLWSLAFRIVVATGVAVLIMMAPPPGQFPLWADSLIQPVVVFVLICYIGKLLYDTLFYDRYVP